VGAVLAAVGVAAVVVVAARVVPAFLRARNTVASNACVMHLRQIEGAKQQWAVENHKTTNDVPTWNDLRSYVGRSPGQVLTCPEGGTYTLGRVGEPPRCSIGGTHTLPPNTPPQ
jgi:ABC-type proline/glycine betaine transport system substrate-binding protein